MKLKNKQKKEITKFGEYIISGGAYFWSGYFAFFILDKILNATFFWSKSISTLVGWSINYLLQRFWVFNNPKLKKHQIEVTSRYIIITLVDFVLDFLIVLGLKEIGITPYIGQFLSAGFFTVWNYFWYKYWVFPEKFAKKAKNKHIAHNRLAHRSHARRT